MNQEPPEHAGMDPCSDAQTAIVDPHTTYATHGGNSIGQNTAAKTGATRNSAEITAEAWKIASAATMENAFLEQRNVMGTRQVLYIPEKGII